MNNFFHYLYGESIGPWVVLFALVAFWAHSRNSSWLTRGDKKNIFILSATAFFLRAIVPMVPANWYATFAHIDAGFDMGIFGGHFDLFGNVSILKFFLFLIPGTDSCVFMFNCTLGVLSVAFLYSGLRGLKYSVRTSFIISLLVAVTPLYVRLSSSECQHVLIFFCYCLALAAFASYTRRKRVLSLAIFFLCILLAAPIRVDTYMGFWTFPFLIIPLYPSFLEAVRENRKLLMTMISACFVAGLILSSGDLENILPYIRPEGKFFPIFGSAPNIFNVLLFRFYHMGLRVLSLSSSLSVHNLIPFFIFVFYWIFIAVELAKWRIRNILWAFIPLLCAFSPHIISMKGVDAFDMPTSRYIIIASLFWIIPAARGIDMIVEIFKGNADRIKKFFLYAGGSTVILVSILVLWHNYFTNLSFQEEYLFLKKSLPKEGTILVLWPQESGRVRTEVYLAQVNVLTYANRPNLEWIIIDPYENDSKKKLERAIERESYEDFYWYRLPLVKPGPRIIDYSGNPNNSMELFKYLDSLIESKTTHVVHAEDYITSNVGPNMEKLFEFDCNGCREMPVRIYRITGTKP